MSRLIAFLSILIAVVFSSVQIPGHEGSDFSKNEKVDIFAGRIVSRGGSTGFDYHSIDWCTGNEFGRYSVEDDRIDEQTEYRGTHLQYKIGQNDTEYNIACTRRFNETQRRSLKYYSRYKYNYKLALDGLPSVVDSGLHER